MIVLVGGRRESSDSVDQYIVQYCRDGAHKSNNKFPIWDVMDLTLRTILFCIPWVAGSTGPHLATREQVNYVVLCRYGVLYNQSATLLTNMKEQLTRCRTRRQRQFCYGSILASFFFEQVPVMRPWGSMPSYSM